MAALALFACQAGPSAFDRSEEEDASLPETADVAALPHVPEAHEVEPVTLPEADTTTAPRGASSPGEAAPAAGRPPSDSVEVGGPASDTAASDTVRTPAATTVAPPPHPRFPEPEHVRGIYLNAWAAGSTERLEALLELARRTEINTFVIDIKDATGYVSHPTSVPLAREIGATEEVRIRDLPALLDRLEEEGIYPIARIVIVKDPLLVAARPELAVQDTAGGVWVDSKGIVWLNLFDERVWEYHLELAREVAEAGFPEIQWDYVRFPDAPRSDLERAVFPGGEGLRRVDAVRGFLAYSRERLAELGVRSTADVFGIATSASRDVGIGQLWESFIDVVDVALPMVYPSHYWQGSFGIDTPNAHPYEVVRRALEDALRRSEAVEGAGRTRPWLQDFSLGQPPYGAPEVRAQIQAAYDVGIREWILWNPSSRYTEEALAPAEGFPWSPLMRLAGRLVPVEERLAVLDSVAAAASPADSTGATSSGTARRPAPGG